MSQGASIPNPMRNGSERSDAVSGASRMERLEYRSPHPAVSRGSESGHAEMVAPGAPPLATPPLAEEWMRPASAGGQTASDGDVSSATAAGMTEEQWRQERAQLEARLAEQNAAASRAIAAARDEGRREGRQMAEAAMVEEQGHLRQQIVDALEEFRQQRERYFHSVEREVVRLSLAIAARVLHRQAQMDPLFLAGAVRVALDKLNDTSGVVLRVAPAQVLAWQEMFRLHSGARMQPEILGDLSLKAGECVLETRLGTVELGVKAQLEEIEKGFFDLLHHHPTASRAPNDLGAQQIA